jgi:hypothetical protein
MSRRWHLGDEILAMTNFLLGTVAGALIAGVVAITAVRQPEIQARLGLRPQASLAAAPVPVPRPEKVCPPPAEARKVGGAEMLLAPRRFWWVAP